VARTSEARILTETHKRRQEVLTASLLAELVRLWRQIVNPGDPRTFHAFAEAAAAVIGLRRAESAALAADYYAAFRAAEGVGAPGPLIAGTALAAVPGEKPEVVPREVPRERVVGLIRGAALSGMVAAVRAGLSPAEAMNVALVRVQGSASRVVLNGGRDLLSDAVRRDPAAIGWYRVTDDDPCHFCAMLASRGLYKKRVTVVDRTRWVRTRCDTSRVISGHLAPARPGADGHVAIPPG